MFATSIFAALVALPFLAPLAQADSTCTRTYTIQDGDVCDSISAANNASTYQLAVVNPKIDASCSNLQIGDTLCLGTSGEDCTTTYVIQANDTCDQLTASHAINSTMLYANNPQINVDCTNLYIGEVLCMAGSFAAPPAPSSIPAVNIPATATPAVASSTAVAVTTTDAVITTSATPVATTTAAAATTTATDDGDDEDDLPWCDEL